MAIIAAMTNRMIRSEVPIFFFIILYLIRKALNEHDDPTYENQTNQANQNKFDNLLTHFI